MKEIQFTKGIDVGRTAYRVVPCPATLLFSERISFDLPCLVPFRACILIVSVHYRSLNSLFFPDGVDISRELAPNQAACPVSTGKRLMERAVH